MAAQNKKKSDAPRPAPSSRLETGRPPSGLAALARVLITEDVPSGVEFTGVLRTANARPLTAVLGVLIGVGSFLTFTPVLTQLLGACYWLAVGRPGAFTDTYQHLVAFESPFGVAMAHLGIALLIPISLALLASIHHVRPAYVFSVRPGIRWPALAAFVIVAAVTLNGVLWLQNLSSGRQPLTGPQDGVVGFLVAIVLTSPLQAAAEEVFFRGYLLQALGALSRNRWFGIVASALLFAAFHGVQNPWLFGSRFAFGILAAYLVVALGGLEAPIAAHVVNNVSAFTYAAFSTGVAALRATTEVTPAEAVWETATYATFTAVALVVGRRLGLERRTAGASGLGHPASVR